MLTCTKTQQKTLGCIEPGNELESLNGYVQLRNFCLKVKACAPLVLRTFALSVIANTLSPGLNCMPQSKVMINHRSRALLIKLLCFARLPVTRDARSDRQTLTAKFISETPGICCHVHLGKLLLNAHVHRLCSIATQQDATCVCIKMLLAGLRCSWQEL